MAPSGYPARAMRRLASSLLILTALALGACGGGDSKDDNASKTSATTGTTGSTTESTTGTTTEDKGGKSGSGKGGKKAKSGGGSGSGGASSTSGGDSTQTQTKTSTTPTTPPASQNVNPRKTARTVCGTFLPDPISRKIKHGKITKQKVAKQYSKGYPEDQRSEAYKGCLEGLNKRHY
jgi:hypothetical protein